MKVAYFTKYSSNGASSRLRSYQYFPLLEKENIEISVFPFFDENYLNDLYAKKGISKLKFLRFYCIRFFSLFSIFNYDRIVIEKELFPYFFSWFEKLLWLLNVNYIVDYDDAIFHNYDLSDNKFVRLLFKNKINSVMKYSGHVLAGNTYLAERAIQSGAKNVIVQPTTIDIGKYIAKKDYFSSKIVIGWIGSPTTYKYVKNLKLILKYLFDTYDVEFHVIGIADDGFFDTNVTYVPWSEETEVESISKLDIGIMPLEDTPWELGKCSYKLIQYMGCGIPVVASNVGMNNYVVENGENGYLTSGVQDWIEKLSLLIENQSLRENLGKHGRSTVEKEFSNKKSLETLLTILKHES